MLRPYPIIFIILINSALSNDNNNSDILEFTILRNSLCEDIENCNN